MKIPVYALGKTFDENPVGFSDDATVKEKTLIVQPEEIDLEHIDATKLKIRYYAYTAEGQPKPTIELTTKDGEVIDLLKLNIQTIELKLSVHDIVTEVKFTTLLL